MTDTQNIHVRERRAYKRFEVMAYARQQPETLSRYYFVRDLSEAGAFLVAQNRPPLGSILKFNLSIRFLKETIAIEARVVRHSDRGFAVAFKSISMRNLQLLRHYLYRDKKEKFVSRFISPENLTDSSVS